MTHLSSATKFRPLRLAAALAALSLLPGATSCRDEFNADTISEPAKLVLNCFPSAADTTWLDLTHSLPVGTARSYMASLTVAGARIVYTVNGQPRPVVQADSTRYYVVGPHQPGDRVEVTVSADGYEPIQAATVVPRPVGITLDTVLNVRAYDPEWEQTMDFIQLRATFTDPAATTDYYALRVRIEHTSEAQDTLLTFPYVFTGGEPLLNPLTDVDMDFGFSKSYLQQFYYFSDALVSGKTYTLHLNTDAYNWRAFYDQKSARYQVLLMRISPELYRYAESLNSVDDNDLASAGLTLLNPTYSNVSHGIGVLAGYSLSESNWVEYDFE